MGTADDFYNGSGEGQPPTGRDYQKYTIYGRGQLRLKAYPDIKLVDRNTRRPLALSTIARRGGVRAIVWDELGFSNSGLRNRTHALPAQTVSQIQRAGRELDKVVRASAGRYIEVADFVRAAFALSEIKKTALKTIEAPPLTISGLGGSELKMRFRELKGLEAASSNRKALRSQISRVRATLRRILHENTTLVERIKTLVREQGTLSHQSSQQSG